MSRIWRMRTHIRPWIAVAASYVVTLQMLLGGITTGQLAATGHSPATGPFVICFGSSAGTPRAADKPVKLPAHEPTCTLCTMAAASPAIFPNASEIHLVFFTEGDFVEPLTVAAVFLDCHTPRQSQGPPQTA